jgi:hypothetical protein
MFIRATKVKEDENDLRDAMLRVSLITLSLVTLVPSLAEFTQTDTSVRCSRPFDH